jgi:hypothetical protein
MKGSMLLAALVAALLAALTVAGCAKSESQAAYTTPDTKAKAAAYITDPTRLSETEISERAADAYVFGYPLVLMDVTREAMTSEDDPKRGRAATNQITHMRELPDEQFREVVSPNADTLYSSAWIDVGKEPVVLSVPNTGGRYYVMQLLDAWTNVIEAPGARTTGTDKLEVAIVGPEFDGRVPRGVKRITSPTNMVWLIGRIETNGKKDDLALVHALQDGISLRPLSVYDGKAAPKTEALSKQKTGPADATAPEKVLAMDAQTFFTRLNTIMAKNPPTYEDSAAMARFETIGVSPGKPFSFDRYPKEVVGGLEKGAKEGARRVTKAAELSLGKLMNGWNVLLSTGNYGANYDVRAVVAHVGLGANLPEDAVYPTARVDADGNALDGQHRYIVQFEKDAIPPVRAFWSLTVYDRDQYLVGNERDRFALGDRDPLKRNADGSITIYLQAESPGKDKESNWLPIPPEEFNVMLRLYWPQKAVLDGEWAPPPIERVRG